MSFGEMNLLSSLLPDLWSKIAMILIGWLWEQ